MGLLTLWARSHFHADRLEWGWRAGGGREARTVQGASNRGTLGGKTWWGRMSRPMPDGFDFARDSGVYPVVGFNWSRQPPSDPPPRAALSVWQQLRLGYHRSDKVTAYPSPDLRRIETSRWFRLPHVVAALLAAVLPASGLLAWRRRRRRASRGASGLCPACGYDVRATPGGARTAGRSPATCEARHPPPKPLTCQSQGRIPAASTPPPQPRPRQRRSTLMRRWPLSGGTHKRK